MQFPVLDERKDQLAGILSGGEQQVLAISRALMATPDLLLLDEPSMGLAPLMVSRVFDAIREMHKEGLTLLIVEQKAYATLKIVGRAYLLTNGKIKLSGTAEELLKNEEIKLSYLGKRNLPGTVSKYEKFVKQGENS